MLPSSIYLNSKIHEKPPLIEADPVQLGQAIVNLIINARDAVGEKGEISIEIDSRANVQGICSSCMQDIEGEFLELKVSDTGDGVAYEKIEKIFEPFVTSKDIGKGTGMGLAMVHGIVHEHGGHVMVETEQGCGAKFSLFFPVSEKTECSKESDTNLLNSHNHKANEKLVMVVDDEIMITNLLHEILTSFEYDVETYYSGTEALQAYKIDPDKYDLVITDHTMPTMTGAELSENILKINPNQPIILCTGYSDYMDENRAEQLGIAAFMHKPLDHSELMHTVELLTDIKH
jgi:CheY-like chemotaxis protein